ncbi:MAG: glycosyltransferase [Candidatus Scatovivens sp.]
MSVAIIVLNYNSEEDTIKYINEIKDYKILDKIIVVDNMSTTINAFEKLKKLENNKIEVIQSDKNGGYSYGNNYALKYLDENNEKYDYIIISNPDVSVTEEAITECLNKLEEKEDVAIVAPRMFDKENIPIRRSSWKIRTPKLDMIHSTRLLEILFYRNLRKGEYSNEEYKNSELEVEAISGAFFIIKHDIFKKIGYFDDNVFLFYEEDILSKKIKKLGYKILSLNNINFIHYESKTINKTHSYYKRIKQLYTSKMYYQREYNKINKFQEIIFNILNVFRILELLIEIPIRKLLRK